MTIATHYVGEMEYTDLVTTKKHCYHINTILELWKEIWYETYH